jgi:hypothetical protein
MQSVLGVVPHRQRRNGFDVANWIEERYLHLIAAKTDVLANVDDAVGGTENQLSPFVTNQFAGLFKGEPR